MFSKWVFAEKCSLIWLDEIKIFKILLHLYIKHANSCLKRGYFPLKNLISLVSQEEAIW